MILLEKYGKFEVFKEFFCTWKNQKILMWNFIETWEISLKNSSFDNFALIIIDKLSELCVYTMKIYVP